MLRTNNCGELNLAHVGNKVTLAGWVQKTRNKGFMIWIDLRDRYGITQIIFDEERTDKKTLEMAQNLGREFVIQVEGTVILRESKNPNMPTGAIEILAESFKILNASKTPPFTIENETDGGEELRMQYRYLDIRRNPVRENLIFRSKVSLAIRNYLSSYNFIDVETPYLIKSTPRPYLLVEVRQRYSIGTSKKCDINLFLEASNVFSIKLNSYGNPVSSINVRLEP